MRPVLFSALGYDVASAHVFAGLAALAAYWRLGENRRRAGLSVDELWELLAALAAGVFAGSLGLYLVAYGGGAAANLGVYARGGLPGGSFLGALAGAAAAAAVFARLRRKSFAPLGDALAESAALGLVVMRAGCGLNGCCGGVAGHPAQLYEATGALALLALLGRLRGRLGPGGGLLLFAGGYGALRFAVDFVRAGDPGLVRPLGLTLAQAAGAAAALLCGLALARRHRRPEVFAGALVAASFAAVALWRWDLVLGAARATAASLSAGGAARAHVLGEIALFGAILALAAAVIPRGFELRRDGVLALATGLCGLAAEAWGTRLGLWTYYTGEAPPLWIAPAWSVGALVIDRLAKEAPRLPYAPLAAFALGATLWLSLTGPGAGPAALLGPLAAAAALFAGRRGEDARVLAAGLLCVFFADLWGTTNGCWRYHLAGRPLGLWQGVAFGMGFDAALVLGARKLVSAWTSPRPRR